MITKALKLLKQQLKKFENEALFNIKYKEQYFQAVFIDHKEKQRRAIILIGSKGNVVEATKIVKPYFKGSLFKVVQKKKKPQLTANVTTGKGIRKMNAAEWGTLGGIFTKEGDSTHYYGLSNSHVIAGFRGAQEGDTIAYQSNEVLGTLDQWFKLEEAPAQNYIDAALVKINPSHVPKWVHPQPRSGDWVGPRVNMKVVKNGFATKITEGYIASTTGSVEIEWNGRLFHFYEVIGILGNEEPFNAPGDSGSVVLTSPNNYMVAIVFAQHEEYCWALPIRRIKRLLQ